MSATQEHRSLLGRRTVVAAVGAAGAAAALTACGGGSDDGGGSKTVEQPGSGGEQQGGGAVLAATADIPEGGGMVFAAQKVVVTQPKPGEFKAFSSTCTHQGCAVKDVSAGTITCPCHNSTFDAATGSPTGGPATQPLPAREITVEGDSIRLA
ncbi:Rieske (2Fe-2S) protein [Streptomyces filamentosus]|uniref:Cytochrome bc1 complex Rieske iron-sulfur subunit n=2 Tax=Streptomyces filamentosus TaxID=67294 RepID=A0ABY4V3H8_STRFL|nr:MULTISPECIES: Rieske (2Fe-2S) protein [Streptomyces]EFE73076.1 iron sulfur protein [Streptomyces filamentosus NRRL 15998]ESU47102.1 iron sulfur protein [Streptomyces sp. HCCB10043]EWS90309.1 iron sulfur protein [Streptomyces filamentosus NRRL 11379]MYR77312.1 Rieske 2Fe-2S domain-containing protein [Streptomyces sp. SID5466]USC51015.1 Rieske (2Fe-2S) protein [Streptomyces filamentosus]